MRLIAVVVVVVVAARVAVERVADD